MKLEVVSTPALRRQAKQELCLLMVYLSALLGWAWLATTHALPLLVLCLVSVGLVAAFVRSFERVTQLQTDLLNDEATHG